jgi:hypothetical protein
MCALAATLLVVVGCSSSEPLAFDLAHTFQDPESPFTISGDAADEGVVCSVGVWKDLRMETMDGDPLDADAWAVIFDEAVDSHSIAEATSMKQFECGDGSGTITIDDHLYLDFAELDVETIFTGDTQWGTWTLEGTGDYESISGNGSFVVDGPGERFHYIGEIQS